MRMLVGLAAILMLAGVTFGADASRETTSAAPVVAPAAPAQSEKQVADEIIRRLRRMGFNMIHNRRARPPEYIGELC